MNAIRDFLFGAPLPEDDAGTVTEWVQLAEWSQGEQIVVLALVAAVMAISAWNLRRVSGFGRRAGLLLLRLLVVAVLLYAFYQPALREEKRARSTNAVIILADDSASMTLPHGDMTRRDHVAAFVNEHEALWRKLEQTNVVESYRFSDVLETTDWRDLDDKLTARGHRTTMVEVLEELQKRYRNRDVGGILVLSDGIDNGRAGRTLDGGNDLDRETVRLLESFQAPVYTFGFSKSDIRDVNVHELRYSPFAFKRNQSTIEADVHVHGYDDGELLVELLEEGRLVHSVKRAIEPGQTKYTAAFDYTPMELGHRVYAVRVRPFPDEVTVENNVRHAVVNVNRDKTRVLQIAGHPSWDVRFLRNHLRRTPNIQLISFFILINPDGGLGLLPRGETALIPFPAEDLFVNELGSFDVVLLQDFDYGPFSMPQHLHRIRDYVRDGGALVMVGGRKSLGAGDYAGTELAEVLPVDMAVPEYDSDALDTREFTAELTEAGKTHAITRLAFDPDENVRVWAQLPPLEGLNESLGLANDGVSLLERPNLLMENGKPMPVIAVNEPEAGRVAVIATDSTWRYSMPNAGGGGEGSLYDRLWSNTIRWLIRDPELDLVRVHPANGVRALGETAELEARIFQPDYRPAAEHGFALKIRRRTDMADRANGELVHDPAELKTDDNGRHAISWTADRAGIYDVEVSTRIQGRRLTGRTVFVVSDERPEMRKVWDSTGLLPRIANATKGRALNLDDRNPDLVLNPPRVSDVTSRRYHERWNVPGIFVLACLLFTLEWWLRRRSGLL